MKEIIASPNRVLHLGYEGEDNVTLIEFPYDDTWLDCGDGEFKIRVLRHGDTQAYNATEVTDDRETMTLTMTVTDIELSVRGRGELQLVYICSGAVKKSEIFRFNVNRAIDSEVVDPPEGSIIAEVEKSLAEIKDEIGSLSELTTTDKTSLVSAINEVNAKEVEVTVDSEMSDMSENPVYNKAVKQYVDNATKDKVTQFIVTITGDNDTYTADKTYQQISVAYFERQNILAVCDGITFPLFALLKSSFFFGMSGTMNGDLMSEGFYISQNNIITRISENASLRVALNEIYAQLNQKASTDTATQSANGLMSAQDKTKLDGLGNSGVSDVQIDGTSIVTDGVAEIPIAGSSQLGAVKIKASLGISINGSGQLMLSTMTLNIIKSGSNLYYAVSPGNQHQATFYGLAKAAGHDEKDSPLPVGQYTEEAKSAISDMLNGAVQVEGTTPTITALSGVRYVCGEVATLDITPCVSGICDIVFTSGSTATVLTLPNTVKFPDGAFTPEANTTYEINILDGVYGAVMAWT